MKAIGLKWYSEIGGQYSDDIGQFWYHYVFKMSHPQSVATTSYDARMEPALASLWDWFHKSLFWYYAGYLILVKDQFGDFEKLVRFDF